MRHKSLSRRACFCAVLLALLMGSGGAGCGREEEAFSSQNSAVDVRAPDNLGWIAGPFGSSAGRIDAPTGHLEVIILRARPQAAEISSPR